LSWDRSVLTIVEGATIEANEASANVTIKGFMTSSFVFEDQLRFS